MESKTHIDTAILVPVCSDVIFADCMCCLAFLQWLQKFQSSGYCYPTLGPCIYFLALTKSHAAACLILPTPFRDHVCCIYIAERNDDTIMQLRVWFLTCYSCVSKGVEYSEYKYISGNVIIH